MNPDPAPTPNSPLTQDSTVPISGELYTETTVTSATEDVLSDQLSSDDLEPSVTSVDSVSSSVTRLTETVYGDINLVTTLRDTVLIFTRSRDIATHTGQY